MDRSMIGWAVAGGAFCVAAASVAVLLGQWLDGLRFARPEPDPAEADRAAQHRAAVAYARWAPLFDDEEEVAPEEDEDVTEPPDLELVAARTVARVHGYGGRYRELYALPHPWSVN